MSTLNISGNGQTGFAWTIRTSYWTNKRYSASAIGSSSITDGQSSTASY